MAAAAGGQLSPQPLPCPLLPQTYEHNEWIIHLAGKLLANDAQALSLLGVNPFEGTAPPRSDALTNRTLPHLPAEPPPPTLEMCRTAGATGPAPRPCHHLLGAPAPRGPPSEGS